MKSVIKDQLCWIFEKRKPAKKIHAKLTKIRRKKDKILNSWPGYITNEMIILRNSIWETYSFLSLKFLSPAIDYIGIIDRYTYHWIDPLCLELVNIVFVARDVLSRTNSSVCSLYISMNNNETRLSMETDK